MLPINLAKEAICVQWLFSSCCWSATVSCEHLSAALSVKSFFRASTIFDKTEQNSAQLHIFFFRPMHCFSDSFFPCIQGPSAPFLCTLLLLGPKTLLVYLLFIPLSGKSCYKVLEQSYEQLRMLAKPMFWLQALEEAVYQEQVVKDTERVSEMYWLPVVDSKPNPFPKKQITFPQTSHLLTAADKSMNWFLLISWTSTEGEFCKQLKLQIACLLKIRCLQKGACSLGTGRSWVWDAFRTK